MPRAISQLLIITENLKVFEIPILLGKKAQHPIIAGTQRIPNHDYYCDTIKLLKVTRTHRSSQFSLQRITAPNIFFNASQLPIFASTHHSSRFSLQRITAPNFRFNASQLPIVMDQSPNWYGPKSQFQIVKSQLSILHQRHIQTPIFYCDVSILLNRSNCTRGFNGYVLIPESWDSGLKIDISPTFLNTFLWAFALWMKNYLILKIVEFEIEETECF